VISAVPENRRTALQSLDVDGILSVDSSPLFFLELINVIKRDWDGFQHIFEMEKNKVELMLEEINRSGRPDAHAKIIEKNEFDQLRLYFNKLEVITKEWG
jgi:hypothetical protein